VAKFTKIGISGFFALLLSLVTFGWNDSSDAKTLYPPGNDGAKQLPTSCVLKPERGPCKGMFERYYFDAGANECKPFVYGGCDGVVPFETKEECTTLCIDRKTEMPDYPPFTGHKYGGVGIRDFENAE
jgi:hypothetical protein